MTRLLVLMLCFCFAMLQCSLGFVFPRNTGLRVKNSSQQESKTILAMAIRSQRFRPINRRRLRKEGEEKAPLLSFEQKKEYFEKLEEWANKQEVYDLWSEKELAPLLAKYQNEKGTTPPSK